MTLERTSTNQSRRSKRSHHSHSNSETHSRSHNSIRRTRTNQSLNGKETPDHLQGHLNHLTPDQERALEEFKAVCIEKGLYTPAEEGKAASHEDPTLLRFLRARKFDVNGALDQFKATEEWRKANQIDALYENFDVDSYENARRVYPQWTGRRDRRGIPVYVFVIKHLTSKNMAAYSSGAASTATSSTHTSSTVPSRLLRLFALYENMTRFVVPLCSSLPRPNPETPISSTTNIVDILGVGLKQFWNLKGHMQDASVLATAHYPETLDRIFIIGAPSFFPTVWGWIKRWFDPVTTSKIFILSSSEVKSTLTSFMDPSSFPKQYGGELDWEWGDMPNLDEPAQELVGALEGLGPKGDGEISTESSNKTVEERKRNFVKGPVAWLKDRIEIFGSIGGQKRRKTIPVQGEQKPSETDQAVVSEANGVVVEVTPAATTEGEEKLVTTPEAQVNGTTVSS
ncbi:CRAL/TRIO domain containing protein [Coccidioides posadasii C735 delta SOWgp]|uniref:CRAL/TRIO domain containing protein n=1 Tax=Coccidioides posadasii (strain C735) TaxID=222929 RepID=C5P504_COCP7|nr:CRAL/TRIO domain containing protein [Coccidioides posadasii C735 delta SOWgp]EER27794.1 CRAL/TRIO domain containing protein [Coccidioides posadasii C735 delta SOWgp]|eukprot:XP_003069939.1 CRAL/TRIO domain containing protein [Coccidioides posadasii C735 delta SOWgp]